MPALRLFCVKDRDTRKVFIDKITDSPVYFHDKMAAKRMRDALDGGKDAWMVSKGPDHRLYVED